MADRYTAEQAAKKKTGKKALWVLFILLVIVIAIIAKILIGSSLTADNYSGMPTSDETYAIAKEFITPTLKSESNSFEDSRYQFAKGDDSVFVIKSSVITTNANGEDAINFKIRLKYNGGDPSKQKNWTVIDIDKNQ